MNNKVTTRPELVEQGIELSVNHLKQYFKFGHGPKAFVTKAVHNVSFDIKKGECFGLVGESGCGKTTTGRSLIRLYNITSGDIYFEGVRISAGTKYNEEQIKEAKANANKRIKELKLERKIKIDELVDTTGLTAELNSLLLKKEQLLAEIKDLKAEYDLRISIANEIPDEDERQNKSEEINAEYSVEVEKRNVLIFNADNRIKEIKEERKTNKAAANITPEIEAQIKDINDDYNAQITAIKQEAADIISEQKELIAQAKFDNAHVDKKLMSKMQMIFQDPVDSLDPRMTVADIIQEGLHIQGEFNPYKNSQKVKDALVKVGLLPEYASRYPHEFSGGQRQRIGIARALIMNPNFLICDEPISALDVSIRAQIINLLNDLKEEMGLTMLFIAHDLSVVKYFCDRIAVMYFGEIVELASSDELFKNPLHPYTNALLSAIPKPDPISEKTRKRFKYEPKKEHDYSKEAPKLVEIVPGHFVLANTEELEKYKKKLR